MKLNGIRTILRSVELPGLLRNPYALLSIFWLLACALANPFGDFPLNDDWAYGRNVYYLVEEGRLAFSEWPAMTLVAQVLWGAAWCKLFGFSFTVLRFSTLVLGLAGLFAFYASLRELGGSRRLSVWSALVLGLNPLYFSLSFTFMTDVPFLALFLLSIFLFIKAWGSGRVGHIVIGTLLAIAATLIRQFGLLAPLAFGLAWLGRERNIKSVWPALAPLAFTWLAMQGYTGWLEQQQGLSVHFGRPEDALKGFFSTAFWTHVSWRPGAFLFYWGVFLLPFTFRQWPTWPKGKMEWGFLIGLVALAVLAAIPAWPYLPTGNVWDGLSLGPKVLKDTYFGKNLNPELNPGGWGVVKILAFIGGGSFLWQWVLHFRREGFSFSALHFPGPGSIPGLALLGYLLYLLAGHYFFDRYHLPALPLLMLLLVSAKAPGLSKRPWLAGGLLLGMATFSIAATHDYLAWNRARWRLLDSMVEQEGISPNKIDGGFEFNGWHETGPRNPLQRYGKGWWFVAEDDYALSFGPLDCYTKYKAAVFHRWLPPGKDSMLVSVRQPLPRPDTVFCDAESRTTDEQQFFTSRPGQLMGNGVCRDSTHIFSGKYSTRLSESCPYGFTTWLKGVGPCTRVGMSAWRYGQGSRAGIVISAPDANAFYQTEASHVVDRNGMWEKIQFELTLPESYPDSTVVLYLWNPGAKAVWFDDVSVWY